MRRILLALLVAAPLARDAAAQGNYYNGVDTSSQAALRASLHTLIDDHTILVGLDNNYPGGNGRVPGTPDGTEMITIRFDQSLTAPVPEPGALAMMLAGLGVLAGLQRRCRR